MRSSRDHHETIMRSSNAMSPPWNRQDATDTSPPFHHRPCRHQGVASLTPQRAPPAAVAAAAPASQSPPKCHPPKQQAQPLLLDASAAASASLDELGFALHRRGQYDVIIFVVRMTMRIATASLDERGFALRRRGHNDTTLMS
jgi:hypothetical protein